MDHKPGTYKGPLIVSKGEAEKALLIVPSDFREHTYVKLTMLRGLSHSPKKGETVLQFNMYRDEIHIINHHMKGEHSTHLRTYERTLETYPEVIEKFLECSSVQELVPEVKEPEKERVTAE